MTNVYLSGIDIDTATATEMVTYQMALSFCQPSEKDEAAFQMWSLAMAAIARRIKYNVLPKKAIERTSNSHSLSNNI